MELLGENFLALMMLAFGAAFIVGNVLAFIRPPKKIADDEDTLSKPLVLRSITQIGIGIIITIWALASLFS